MTYKEFRIRGDLRPTKFPDDLRRHPSNPKRTGAKSVRSRGILHAAQPEQIDLLACNPNLVFNDLQTAR